ncbi:PDZ domain-containing protein big bang isoform X3 [Andrena cerasifolii]|uniref:PDZ domain-containing protein big bang isoform X3 n=1 Tax=Andrena cerasifolii TaxID=2819439 RepID=UPI004037D651
MGVASIPSSKDQRASDEWNALGTIRKMDVAKSGAEDFVTVVSVESQPPPDNFVTVLSIGSGKKEDEPGTGASTKSPANGVDGPLEEEVEVFRLPGERLGFGLKFEGGNKTSERVRRLFVQSCAEQSPASRAKCSWGSLGEGDEVLSIDGVPVTHMTRLDCVRRLKESQLVIKLMVRCRGALRPEVVSAEKKTSPEKSKVPPELPSAPPPVPPRKLRQARGLADGEANPGPNSSQSSSQSSSQNSSPGSKAASPPDSKSTTYESCESSPKSATGSAQDSPKGSPKERSPELAKSKQEPPEAMVYVDARSQCGSTHGSTSDDTGSSMSTVIDRFSTSDRVSTISTASTASTTSEQPNELLETSRADQDFDRSSDRDFQLSKAICPFDNLDADYPSNPPDYLLRRLASSEAMTHVESRGEVERITAVVAPNTVVIEETIAFQPPLSFQDAPLSYGHEARPDLFYTADLAADSTTHFRPIKDDVELVERVNGAHEQLHVATSSPEKPKEPSCARDRTPPPLPARNHVNRISVNQPTNDQKLPEASEASEGQQDAPVLPPKPLPRRDVKVRRKRPPPPPPPPAIAPRAEVKPSSLPESRQTSFEKLDDEPSRTKAGDVSAKLEEAITLPEDRFKALDRRDLEESSTSFRKIANENSDLEKKGTEETEDTESTEDLYEDDGLRTNKVLEIIEIRKAKAFSPQKTNAVPRSAESTVAERSKFGNDGEGIGGDEERGRVDRVFSNERLRELRAGNTISTEAEDSEAESDEAVTSFCDPASKEYDKQSSRTSSLDGAREVDSPLRKDIFGRREPDDEDSYRSLNDVDHGTRNLPANRGRNEESIEEDDTTDESDEDDYYWQSNLATIGEEEETNSLEYTTANKDATDSDASSAEKPPHEEPLPSKKDVFITNARNDEVDNESRTANFTEAVAENLNAETVNGRMDNCGGGQRLPPDGDEFPAAYQEFGGGSQQYRFVTTATTARASTMTANGEPFVSNDGFKLIESSVVAAGSIILPDSRVSLAAVESVCQEVSKVSLPNIEINGKATVETVCQESVSPRETRVDDGKPYVSDDFVKKAASVTNYTSYGNQGNGNVVVSEKKIEITGYYHKDVPVIEDAKDQAEKETVDAPPPLPLTDAVPFLSGPPKLETGHLYARNVPSLEPPQRKFSLNGELWRQDDKSERSVRDKIAMFSSQSSLDGPLFPSAVTVTAATSNGRRLSKYKSTEDVCSDEKSPGQKERASFFADRTQSSFDLTDSGRNVGPDSGRKYGQRSPGVAQSPSSTSPTIHASKAFPIVPPKPSVSTTMSLISSTPKSPVKSYSSSSVTPPSSPQNNVAVPSLGSNQNSLSLPLKPVANTALIRATSFSGSMPYGQERSSTANDLSASSQISRTNSLASTFRRPSEDIRRTSLNQLIEQRRRSISKLRGLVIPEKETIPIDTPIVDLPEIKSRDSILLHQLSKANIQDKWGSQSSLASNTSTASVPLKATTSFKMPAPQIHSKYSPAFKRKSLAVYGSASANSSVNGSAVRTPQPATPTSTPSLSEPPKSLESICSPTRSDYSFEFASTASSPEGLRNRPKAAQRKARMDYDDSDNDSAVSSSQSSISRGFSPPISPVPSERSTVSSERSYISTETNYLRRSLIMDSPTRAYGRESSTVEFSGRSSIMSDRTFASERSSSSSSSSDPRSPQPPESNGRSSQIPQRQLKRSNSTETNCSTSSTLTSGSQASAESLSRRVLKPQSVEAINRKNILASARCRSGRDLNGSPLIQRKFPDDGHHSTENGGDGHQMSRVKAVPTTQDIKIAFIEVTDTFVENEPFEKEAEEPKLPPKRSVPPPVVRPPKSEMLEPSNDLKNWVRTEAKALARSAEMKAANKVERKAQEKEVSSVSNVLKNNKSAAVEEQQLGSIDRPVNRNVDEIDSGMKEASKQRSRPSATPKKPPEDQNDLLTILTTKSRTRSAIHVDDGSFGRSKSQMSLEDILSVKADVKLSRAQSVEERTEKIATQNRPLWESRDNRYARRSSTNANECWNEEKPFVSKIPTLGKPRLADSGDEMTEVEKPKSTVSKIPTTRNLGRRSASVTDMKKALEKVEVNSAQHQSVGPAHNRFPSLDSSVDENVSPLGTDMDTDRCCSEQFGSISSLASSTSLISQQELAQLVEEASLEEARGAHDVIVVLLHKENPTGSVGITLAGGADCEVKEITVHRVLVHSIADKDGRVQRGDRILSINGRSTRGLTHRESLAVLKQPRSEVVLVVSRARNEEGCKLKSRTASVETIIEGFETNGVAEDTAWGPPSVVAVYKDGAGLGFSLEGGKDSPLGDRPLVIKKIFTGGAAEKTGALKAGDQLLEVNGNDVTRMSRIEAWSLMKKLHDGEVNLLVRHPATKSS